MGAETQVEVKDKGMEVMPEVLQAMETTEAVVKVGSFSMEVETVYLKSAFQVVMAEEAKVVAAAVTSEDPLHAKVVAAETLGKFNDFALLGKDSDLD